jgi:hypothetical protein
MSRKRSKISHLSMRLVDAVKFHLFLALPPQKIKNDWLLLSLLINYSHSS